jgi:hypothetical protein
VTPHRDPAHASHGAIAAVAAAAASCGPSAATVHGGAAPRAEIVSCVDLPRKDARSHNLSGLAWDAGPQQLLAISDRDRWITPLLPRPGFAGWDFGASIQVEVAIELWDGEAIAIAGDRLMIVANETQPAIFSVDRAGHGATRVELPEFRGIRDNLGLEGLGYAAADGGYVFVVNEQALEHDGPLSTHKRGTLVRILRHSLDGKPDFAAAYLTDPIFAEGPRADNGVSDLAALSPERLLVLERAYVRGRGNAVRVYAVDLHGAQNIAALGDARAAVPLRKRLVVDLAALTDDLCSQPPLPQRRRTLDNYEGLAVGPALPDGRRLLFLVSDDNERPTQVPRLLTIAVAPEAL